MTDSLAEEEGDGAAAALVKGDLEGLCDLVLSTVEQAGEEDGEALLGGEGVLLAQDLDDLGVGEPGGDLLAGLEAVAELGTRNVGGVGARGDLVGGLVLVAVGDVNHLLELDHGDAELVRVLLNGDLGVVRAVVVLAVLVLAGAGVVTADNEVRGAVVLTDNGVPDGLAGTAHAHGQGQQSQGGHAVGVSGEEGLVDTDTGEVINVTGLGHADDGVDEDVGLLGAGGTDSELSVGAVHGVASLESDDLVPAELLKVLSQLGGSDFWYSLVSMFWVCYVGVHQGSGGLTSEVEEVVVSKTLDSLELTTNVKVVGVVEEVLHTGVGVVVAAEDLNGLLDSIETCQPVPIP